ncbi:MAG TPA: hypothetical protein VEA69_03840 [Tepidisphaeraceae bacterium]|nr:hypothetical protein [Tepidisphaeraceae bacterium]
MIWTTLCVALNPANCPFLHAATCSRLTGSLATLGRATCARDVPNERSIVMGWLQDAADRARDVARVVAPVQTTIVDVVAGRPVNEAVRDTVTAPVRVPVDAAADAAAIGADLDSKITHLEAGLAQKVGGDAARKLVLDVRRVTTPFDAQVQKQLVDSTQKFVETLDLEYLNPLVAAMAAELQRARDNHWPQAAPIPAEVISALPPALAEVARGARHIAVAEANVLALPTFAIQHFERATAVAVIDLIFFKRTPSSAGADDLHYWAHEVTHLRQYRDLTLQGFVKRYVHEELSRGDRVNALEMEAALDACRHFPVATAPYIGTCPG